MISRTKVLKSALCATALAGMFCAPAAPAAAQDASAPSESATVNLIRLLVKQGVISQASADALLKQAEAEAEQARAARSAPVASAPATPNQPTKPSSAIMAGTEAQSELPPPAPGTIRVQYVPESVRNQIRDEVKAEVMAQAQRENWAQPEQVPEWTRRFRLFGDFRARDQFDLYSKNNTNEFIDFASFNSNGPTDINNVTNPTGFPYLDTRSDRTNLLNVRVRLGIEAKVFDGLYATIRLAGGDTNSPVSTTQTLGGGLDKKNIWLDQAYFRAEPTDWSGFMLGRMPNPFVHTDLVWDDDLNFDGAAAQFSLEPAGTHGFNAFANLGAFAIDYGPANFPTYSQKKAGNFMKWMGGAQAGVEWNAQDFDWKLAVAYYDFQHIQGQLSAPCALYNGNKECSTDPTRPAFMQKGNTLFLIRDILPDPAHPLNYAQPQFVGLAFDYNVLNANTSLTVPLSGPYDLVLEGDFARNMAYDPNVPFRYGKLGNPINNIGNGSKGCPTCFGPLESGPNAWMAKGTIGEPVIHHMWDWNVSVAYKYIQPDAVLDAYTDSDFHLGGTNAKGFVVGGSLGVYENTWLTARYLSADEVTGPPLAIDVVQLDLNTSF